MRFLAAMVALATIAVIGPGPVAGDPATPCPRRGFLTPPPGADPWELWRTMPCDSAPCFERFGCANEWFQRTLRIAASGRVEFPRRLLPFMRYGCDRYHAYYWGQRPCATYDTPVAAVRQFLLSFVTQDTATFARLVAENYRFLSADDSFAVRFPSGLDRRAQIDSVARLPAAPLNLDSNSTIVRCLSMLAEFSDIASARAVAPDSERARVTLRSLRLSAQSDSDPVAVIAPTACVFLLTRGDEALAPAGEPRDAGRWYVVRWYAGAGLDQSDAALDRLERRVQAPEPVAGTPPPPPPAFGIRCRSRLGEWPIRFEISLFDSSPARFEVFDVAGRRAWIRSLLVGAEPPYRVHIESPRLASGIYWARVRQGNRSATTGFISLR